jgi:FkbM family methyltransferase
MQGNGARATPLVGRQPLPTAPSRAFRRSGIIERLGERFRDVGLTPELRTALKGVYHAALLLQTGRRGLRSVLPAGEVVRTLPAHRSLCWNPAEYEAFRAATPGAGIAIDVGANVGAYALLFGQWVGPRGTVIAFEPEPSVFRGLSSHIHLNRLESVVRPVMAAIGDREDTVDLIVGGTAGEARLAGCNDPQPTIQTLMTTLDSYCARERLQPDVIKVDVEGWELAVLRGARALLSRTPGVALFVEMHPSVWPLIGVTKADVLAEIEAQQLTIEPIAPTEDVWAIEGVCVRLRKTRCAS